MLRGLWNSLVGYVIIQLEGSRLERFINRALSSGIELWDVRRTGVKTMTACVDMEGFYALHKLKRTERCRIKILKKRGAAVPLLRFRWRKALLYGWVAVLALLLGASRFIWFVRVNGCDAIEKTEIVSMLEAMQVRPGTPRRAIQLNALGNALLAADDRIAWAGAELKGVILEVNIHEAGSGASMVKTAPPASVLARKAGVVTHIVAYEGRPLVHEGDAVQKGETLISANMSPEGMAPLFVRARGEVKAKVAYRFSATAGPLLKKSVRTGRTHGFISVRLFQKGLFEPEAPYAAYETETLEAWTLQTLFLPVVFEKRVYYELSEQFAEATEEELEAAALGEAEKALKVGLDPDGRLVSKSTTLNHLENGAVEAVLLVTAEESIAFTTES